MSRTLNSSRAGLFMRDNSVTYMQGMMINAGDPEKKMPFQDDRIPATGSGVVADRTRHVSTYGCAS